MNKFTDLALDTLNFSQGYLEFAFLGFRLSFGFTSFNALVNAVFFRTRMGFSIRLLGSLYFPVQ